ncbi:MAG TPA: carboxypeptidase regulatory-like domain-containing protein [Burkholderiales bacterium]
MKYACRFLARHLAASCLALPLLPAFAADLGGRISSAAEGAMQGVLVSARRDASTITYTVVSGSDGRYDFAAAHLAPGHYTLTIRAAGYELAAPASADLVGGKPAHLDLSLRKAANLAAQLTNAEWLLSMPGTPEQKRPLIECMSCHTLERIAHSKYTAEQLLPVLQRMTTYANNTTMAAVQMRHVNRAFDTESFRKLAAYLASVNLSTSSTWPYPLKTLPRPSSRATRVLITEYDLPRKNIAPHDVLLDAQGRVWYADFVANILGRMDPATGSVKEYPYPLIKPGFPTGALGMEADRDGNWWFAPVFQSGLVKFDIKTEKFDIYRLQSELDGDAAQQTMVAPRMAQVDGKVWANEGSKQSVLRLDLATRKFERIDPFKTIAAPGSHFPYGLVTDAGNNLYFMDFAGEALIRVDAKTTKTTIYPTPTPRSRPRRGMIDERGRIWFAEYAANKVAMFDTREEEFKEWAVPTPHTYPYDALLDRNNEVWSGSMSTDRVLRLDPATGKSVEYLLPRQTNMRKVTVDDHAKPATVWIGSNHGASIIKLTPLD